MGGDGTSRAACKGARQTPILPLSTGTNNVFPVMAEATVAGLAAGVLACGGVSRDEGCTRPTYLEVLVNEEVRDLALVDAAVYDDVFLASRAVWDITRVRQLFFSRCKPESIGLSAVGGQLERVGPEEPRGLALDLDPDFACKVRAAICPGLFADVGVVKVRPMRPGVAVPVGLTPCVLALDGEREVEVRGEECAAVRLAEDRLYVADVEKILEYARQRGIFLRGAQVCYAN